MPTSMEFSPGSDGATSFELDARLRDVPYPYRGMLAFASDIDGSDLESFRTTHGAFLGTAFDPGISLELTNSFWVFSDDSSRCKIALSTKPGAPALDFGDAVADLVRAGVIDTLHTYGNFNNGGFSRSLAEAAVSVLEERCLSIPVWTYHGNHANGQNVLRPPHWSGDDPASVLYHADLFPRVGIRYVCLPRMTAELGHASPLTPVTLKDGQRLWGFERFCWIHDHPDFDAIERAFSAHPQPYIRNGFRRQPGDDGKERTRLTVWNLSLLKYQIAPAVIDQLCADGLIGIFAQHLTRPNDPGFTDPGTISALRALSDRQRAGEVLVAGLARTLDYARVRQTLRHAVGWRHGEVVVEIEGLKGALPNDPPLGAAALEGIAFEVMAPQPPRLVLADTPVVTAKTIEIGPGAWILHVPWRQRIDEQREALGRFEAAVGADRR